MATVTFRRAIYGPADLYIGEQSVSIAEIAESVADAVRY